MGSPLRWPRLPAGGVNRLCAPRARAASWIALFCAWGLVMPVAASAATVLLRAEDRPTLPGQAPPVADVVRYEAAPGEQNVVSVQLDGDADTGTWTIIDTGAVITAVAPCRASDAHTAICTVSGDRPALRAEVELGDLNDRFHSTSPSDGPAGAIHAQGGSGDDQLVGGSAGNFLNGGEGNDALVLRALRVGEATRGSAEPEPIGSQGAAARRAGARPSSDTAYLVPAAIRSSQGPSKPSGPSNCSSSDSISRHASVRPCSETPASI
jgi:hemolysin type calcium-binding protein